MSLARWWWFLVGQSSVWCGLCMRGLRSLDRILVHCMSEEQHPIPDKMRRWLQSPCPCSSALSLLLVCRSGIGNSRREWALLRYWCCIRDRMLFAPPCIPILPDGRSLEGLSASFGQLRSRRWSSRVLINAIYCPLYPDNFKLLCVEQIPAPQHQEDQVRQIDSAKTVWTTSFRRTTV